MPPLRFFRSLLAQNLTPAVTYYVRGTSTNVGATETFNIQYIDDGATTPAAATTETVSVAADGSWEFSYSGKKIYSLYQSFYNKTTITDVDFSSSDGLEDLINAEQAFRNASNLTKVNFTNCLLNNVINIAALFNGCSSLTTIVGSENITFASVTTAVVNISGVNYGAFGSTGLTSLNLNSAIFGNLTSGNFLFYGNSSLTTLNLSAATFAKTTTLVGMFQNCASLPSISLPSATFDLATTFSISGSYWWTSGCTSLQTISLPLATFRSLTDARCAFRQLTALTSVDLSSATFENTLYFDGMFRQDGNLTTITWSANLNMEKAIQLGGLGSQNSGMFIDCTKLTDASINPLGRFAFRNVTVIANMFSGCAALTTIDLHSAIFDKVTSCLAAFLNCTNLIETKLSAATFEKVNDTNLNNYPLWGNDSALTTIDVPQNSTAILPTSGTNANMNLRHSPLTYTSMLKVANWLSDLTGQSAHTCTFKTSAWNALSSAEQTTIDGILSAKNWTRALA